MAEPSAECLQRSPQVGWTHHGTESGEGCLPADGGKADLTGGLLCFRNPAYPACQHGCQLAIVGLESLGR